MILGLQQVTFVPIVWWEKEALDVSTRVGLIGIHWHLLSLVLALLLLSKDLIMKDFKVTKNGW